MQLKGNFSKEWQKDIKYFLRNVQEMKSSDSFAVPEELLSKNRSIEQSIEIAKDLVRMYGRLLQYWPQIIDLYKK
jgi:hypothetical protein